jgi:sugar lactone lactonase YvrE
MLSPVLNCLHIENFEYSSYETPSPLCSIVLCKNGDILAAMDHQFVYLKQPDFRMELLQTIDLDDKNILLNDGKCDAHGRYWIGTRDKLQSRPVSALYLFSEERKPEAKIERLIASNGMGWSPDNRKFYLIDTIKKIIYQYPFDLDKAQLGPSTVFTSVTEEGVYPDGLAIDCEGNIWVAMWGAGKIVCFSEDGSIRYTVDLPAKNISSCCFGGKDFKTLFVTSASIDFAENKTLGKNAGSIFAIDTPVQGLAANYYL